MLITMSVYLVVMWYLARRVLVPASPPAPGRAAWRRTWTRDAPTAPADPVEAAEALVVRQRLAGQVDAATYRDRMAALAAAGPSSPPRPSGVRPAP
jgi:hypothetical protein